MNEQEAKSIQDFGAERLGEIHCLTIIGQVEGHQALGEDTKTTKYEHVLPLLAAIEESPEVGGLLVLINTVGGDVDAGLGIAEMIAGMTKPTASLILGGGHSIGAPLAVAADRSFIAPSGYCRFVYQGYSKYRQSHHCLLRSCRLSFARRLFSVPWTILNILLEDCRW